MEGEKIQGAVCIQLKVLVVSPIVVQITPLPNACQFVMVKYQVIVLVTLIAFRRRKQLEAENSL